MSAGEWIAFVFGVAALIFAIYSDFSIEGTFEVKWHKRSMARRPEEQQPRQAA